MRALAFIVFFLTINMTGNISFTYAQATDPSAPQPTEQIDRSSTDIRFWERRSCPKPSEDELKAASNMIDTQSGKKGDRYIPKDIIESHGRWLKTYELWTIISYSL